MLIPARIFLAGAIVLLSFVPPADAETIYAYSGQPFSQFHGNYACPRQCGISGWFSTADPLPANLTGVPAQNNFNVDFLAYSFTDGNVTATNTNGCADFFTVSTDGTGAIASWVIRINVRRAARATENENGNQ